MLGGRKSVISFDIYTNIYVCKVYIYIQNIFYKLGNQSRVSILFGKRQYRDIQLSYMNSIFLSNTDGLS